MSREINLIFMGNFTYPRGMAGTKRIQHVIKALKLCPEVTTRVILQRQSREGNILSGVHDGTPYETVMGNLLRARMFLSLPILYHRTITALKKAFHPDGKNVIYFYGPLFVDSVVPLGYAQRIGYRIVFDVIEDYDLARELSHSYHHYMRSVIVNRISPRMKDMASGIIAISSYLEGKCRELTQGKVPVHYLPVSVDMACFPEKPRKTKPTVTLFYAGSFGKKDGLPVLLDAFDKLAERYGNVRLVLTGKGDREAMREFLPRLEASPHKGRMEFKGYLEDKEYYSLLNDIDIPCMTRVDVAYAHAGFPFKLGEFLATGKPVIASRVSDVDRFLVNGHNAMLVRPGSSTEICAAAEFVINNPESAVAIGMRGREVAKISFDYKQQGEALLAFLANL